MRNRRIWLGVVGGAAALTYIGLRTPLRPSPLAAGGIATGTVPVPDDLPAPVARYFALTSGDSVPLAIAPRVTGTARMVVPGLPFRLWMQARWQATYLPGKSFTRVMTLGFFGQPLIEAVDHYADGVGSVTVAGQRDDGPNVDQAADLVLWAESIWMPSVLFTTPDLRWQPVDDTRARLLVPYQQGHHEITWHFDTSSGLLSHLTAFRFKGAQARWRTAWRVDILAYQEFQHLRIPASIAITWEDDGKPWAVFNIADLAYNLAQATPESTPSESAPEAEPSA